MKTIKDAVIELGGKLPNRTYTKYSNAAGWYISRCGKLTHAVDCVWFEPEQFEAEAKRLGYINGYLWGKEYPTNGKRPDLPDDVEIEWRTNPHPLTTSFDKWVKVEAGKLCWSAAEAGAVDVAEFRITDQIFKPADTSYLNASTQAQSSKLNA